MNNRKLEWRHLKALHDLYVEGRTSAKINSNGYIRYLSKSKRLIKLKPGSNNVFFASAGYKEYYEREHKVPFLTYQDFLTENDIDLHARQHFDEYDLETFMLIAANKTEIRKNLTTIRHFSGVFFKGKGSKYLDNHPGIARIVCQLLEINEFPDQDPKTNTWRCVVDHPSPRLVVFCENLANLKRPWVAWEQEWELWYVGGNNTGIVERIGPDKLKIPVYYSCDWDLAGLQIYIRLKQILSDKGCSLHLLEPYNKKAIMDVGSPDHNSLWKRDIPYSGLDNSAFTGRHLAFISGLIAQDKWIEEESQDLVELLRYNIAGNE